MKALLLTILITIMLCTSVFSQQIGGFNIEGSIVVYFFMATAKPIDSYITIEGTNKKLRIDSTGYFKMTDIPKGNQKIKFVLWGGVLVKDTILYVENDIKDFQYFLYFDCDVNKYKAIYDIHYDKPKLLLSSGISPITFVGQDDFEKKYNIKYHDYGCISPDNKCIIEYNQTIFDYLDQTQGKQWRKEVRKDVVGWTKKNK